MTVVACNTSFRSSCFTQYACKFLYDSVPSLQNGRPRDAIIIHILHPYKSAMPSCRCVFNIVAKFCFVLFERGKLG